MASLQPPNTLPTCSKVWRLVRLVLLGTVLGLTFLAYLSPDMQLQWENLAALCGF